MGRRNDGYRGNNRRRSKGDRGQRNNQNGTPSRLYRNERGENDHDGPPPPPPLPRRGLGAAGSYD